MVQYKVLQPPKKFNLNAISLYQIPVNGIEQTDELNTTRVITQIQKAR